MPYGSISLSLVPHHLGALLLCSKLLLVKKQPASGLYLLSVVAKQCESGRYMFHGKCEATNMAKHTQDPDEVLLHRLLPYLKKMNANFMLLVLCIFVY